MKRLYTQLVIYNSLIILLLSTNQIFAQCASGYVPTGKSYDTTVTTGSGNYETLFTFPKFRPDSGFVTCVKLTMTITGAIEALYFENNSSSSNEYSAEYIRKDSLSGPGLSSALTSSVNKTYGPYILAPKTSPINSGPDYKLIENDTILNSYTVSSTITDVNEISNFYGIDSVTYRYGIKASTTPTGPGDYSFGVATVGFVSYKLEYCYCPPTVLPIGLINFEVKKTGISNASISWKSETDTTDYVYEIQVSRDGKNFFAASTVQKKAGINPGYVFHYEAPNQQYGQFYFRVKQRYPNGYTSFTTIRSLNFENPFLAKISLYPNPSTGIVGIKFVNIPAGKLNVQITNVQGQTVVQKEFVVSGTDYKQIAVLQRGMYWMRIKDVNSLETVVNQLLIK